MAIINTGYQNADVHGRAAFEVLDTFVQSSLLASGEPGLSAPTRVLLASNLPSLPQFQVVGLNADKRLAPAVKGSIEPIGTLAHATPPTGANNTAIRGETFLEGVFNIGDDDAGTGSPLVWDASFATREDKAQSVVGKSRLQFRPRFPNA